MAAEPGTPDSSGIAAGRVAGTGKDMTVKFDYRTSEEVAGQVRQIVRTLS